MVPIDPAALSQRATASLRESSKRSCRRLGWDEETFERRLFLARKAMERKGTHLEGFTIPSVLPHRRLQGTVHRSKIDQFYWDLRDPRFETSFAIFHQRYSTNTFPSWSIAQPFRCVAHNGEINTIRSNRAWMVGREGMPLRRCGGTGSGRAAPVVLEPEQSDSGSLDNAFELLLRTGRSLAHVKEMLLPAAWENLPDLDPDLRAFYEYHAFLTEPWDGPAAIAATDGKVLLEQWTATGCGPPGGRSHPMWSWLHPRPGSARWRRHKHRHRTARPGETITFEPATGRIAFSDQIRSELAAQAPYRSWVDAETLYVQDPFDPLQDDRFDPATVQSGLRVHRRGAPHGAQGHGRGEDPDRRRWGTTPRWRSSRPLPGGSPTTSTSCSPR